MKINIESQSKWLTLKSGVIDSFVHFWYIFPRNWSSDAFLVSGLYLLSLSMKLLLFMFHVSEIWPLNNNRWNLRCSVCLVAAWSIKPSDVAISHVIFFLENWSWSSSSVMKRTIYFIFHWYFLVKYVNSNNARITCWPASSTLR